MTVLKTSLRNFYAHKGRMVLSMVAVLLSVAFVCGTLVFTDTVDATFDKLFDSTAADLTVQPKAVSNENAAGARAVTMPSSVVDRVAAEPGVKSAHGSVQTTSVTLVDPKTDKNLGPTSGAPTIAANWSGAFNPHPALDHHLRARAPRAPRRRCSTPTPPTAPTSASATTSRS